MVFQVNYTETLRGSYILEADSGKEAIESFEHMMNAGQIDTLDLDVVDSDISADLVGHMDENGMWVYEPNF